LAVFEEKRQEDAKNEMGAFSGRNLVGDDGMRFGGLFSA
jgi:hypothetical protein